MGSQLSKDGFRPRRLAIFLNDFTDSDNEAAAEAWAWAMEMNPDIEAIYIAEPRHDVLGLAMTGKQIGACAALLRKHFPSLPDPPMTTILRGSLSPDALEKIQGLSDEESALLKLAIKPSNGPEEDSVLHTRLMTLDYLTVMKERCKRPFSVFIDQEVLVELQSPINLHMHHHEELVARTRKELEAYHSIMTFPLDKRRRKLRIWYQEAIDRKLKQHAKDPIETLDIDRLSETIRQHDDVTFFGGASLSVLQRLLQRDEAIGRKIRVYQQGGTFDPKLNILGNPYNFALHPDAADYIFKNHEKLAKFVLIPTDTTKKVEYDLKNLQQLSSTVAYRSIAFHLRLDPINLVSPNESYDGQEGSDPEAFIKRRATDFEGYADKKVVLADLTAFLLSFTDAFGGFKSKVGAIDSRRGGNIDQMVLKRDDKSTIEVLTLDVLENAVTVIGKTGDFVKSSMDGYFPGT